METCQCFAVAGPSVWNSLPAIIIIIIKDIYIAQVRKGHKCAMSAEMAVWLLYDRSPATDSLGNIWKHLKTHLFGV